jgi:hypothetical protein
MLFGDFDWNRVLMMGLIGGVVGLIAVLFKKKDGSGKDGSGDDSKKGKGDQ